MACVVRAVWSCQDTWNGLALLMGSPLILKFRSELSFQITGVWMPGVLGSACARDQTEVKCIALLIKTKDGYHVVNGKLSLNSPGMARKSTGQ